jgi:transposase
MWYIGLDWADTHHDVEVLDEAGKRVGARRFAHNHAGLHELQAFLLGIAPEVEQLACIVETTHGLLITFLLEAGIPVYPVNPKTANQLRKAAGAKTDQIDAHLLAKIGRLELAELRRLEPDSPTVQELKTLTRDQDALIQTQTRLVNQLTACLKEYYPAALHLFAKLQQRSALVFLQAYPTPQAASAASVAELTATLRSGKHTNPIKAAPKIFEELHRPHLVASEVTVRAKSRLLLSLVKQLLVVIQEIASYDKAISTLFLTHKDHELWSSLPRAGKRLAPRLLAEWGEDRSRYADAGSVQTLAGTAPVPFQSGNYAKAHKRFACLKPLRNALYQFAWQSTRQEAWALAYYQRKRAEGKTHSMAVRALANVWVRIVRHVGAYEIPA